ncbi:hypothetical protein ST201phi2-1p051 [Pseudomonas phage 201phi2-1]|uniref:Uncharacterized protein n=1 Tax=Pseudomonas phage 201phi2-1 TaxID=198110 RepID=B3FK26_BP201|nr:hypothetical protein ST201phi2-1p051 [Pseudomonas phage 201phi2-1]ABY62884.1 hypothetical protein 201phi2-1p051 [Pseudomonas phage 201phi2-1]
MQEDDSRGSTISFGQMNLMPAITVHGRDYGVAYENMTEEHLKGIPVRIEGRTIGYVESLKDGTVTLKLNEGETLDLAPEPQATFSIGNTAMMGKDLEVALLDNVDQVFKAALNLEVGNESSK